MLKSLTLAVVLASAIASLGVAPASAAGTRSTAAECQKLYDLSRNDSQSYRVNRDAYISCVGNL